MHFMIHLTKLRIDAKLSNNWNKQYQSVVPIQLIPKETFPKHNQPSSPHTTTHSDERKPSADDIVYRLQRHLWGSVVANVTCA